jgi:hypothetical protein
MSKTISGYYAKQITGTTLYQFEWSATDQLFLVLDDKTKKLVNANEYEIVDINQITG